MIGKKLYKPVKADEYIKTSDWCNEHDAVIVDKGDYFEVAKLPEDPLESLKQEKYELQNWIDKHRDITMDVLLGITTEEESNGILSEMRNKRRRLKEIESILNQSGTSV